MGRTTALETDIRSSATISLASRVFGNEPGDGTRCSDMPVLVPMIVGIVFEGLVIGVPFGAKNRMEIDEWKTVLVRHVGRELVQSQCLAGAIRIKSTPHAVHREQQTRSVLSRHVSHPGEYIIGCRFDAWHLAQYCIDIDVCFVTRVCGMRG